MGERGGRPGPHSVCPLFPKVRNSLQVLKPKAQQPTEPVKLPVIGIILKVNEADATIQLFVSYLVSNASWSPKYDLRVSSQERKMEVYGGGEPGMR